MKSAEVIQYCTHLHRQRIGKGFPKSVAIQKMSAFILKTLKVSYQAHPYDQGVGDPSSPSLIKNGP